MKVKNPTQTGKARKKQEKVQQNAPLGTAAEANREKKRTGPNLPAT